MKLVIHIPARKGSKRVPRKNFRDLCGKPMIEYSIISALNSKITDKVYINTDDIELAGIMTSKYPELKFFNRDISLTQDKVGNDEFNFDFIQKIKPDVLMMINPVCPLVTEKMIADTYQYYLENDYDTVISASKSQMQFFCKGEPVNINIKEKLGPSQLNPPVYELNWAISLWECSTFIQNMESKGFAAFGTNLGIFEIDKFAGIKVSNENDFLALEALIQGGYENRL